MLALVVLYHLLVEVADFVYHIFTYTANLHFVKNIYQVLVQSIVCGLDNNIWYALFTLYLRELLAENFILLCHYARIRAGVLDSFFLELVNFVEGNGVAAL